MFVFLKRLYIYIGEILKFTILFVCVIKSVPKVIAHFAFFVNIFRNFNAICDFSFAMNSYGHKANFQPKQLRNPLILLSKNEEAFLSSKMYMV